MINRGWIRGYRAVWTMLLVWLGMLAGCSSGGRGPAGQGDSTLLALSPQTDFLVGGLVGGSFAPSSGVYTLSNVGLVDVNWTATAPDAWLTLDQSSGSLLPGQTVDITASVDQAVAMALATGSYQTSITFHELPSQGVTLNAVLTVSDPPVVPPDTMATATRTTGIAPLLVVFDAADTIAPVWSSGVVQPLNGDFAPFQYNWDFGDAAAGTWSVGAPSRNSDTGYIAAHVFEQPGIYQVTLHVLTPTDQDLVYTQNIDVQGFSGTTYYVSSSIGNNANSGTTPTSPLATFAAGIAKQGANVRILFKRGETFPTAGGSVISAAGPGIVGAYGSGPNPMIAVSTGTNASTTLSVRASDWRVSDLDFTGAGLGGNDTGRALEIAGPKVRNALALRVGATGYGSGIEISDPTGAGGAQQFHENIGFVDCRVHDLWHYGIYVGALHLVVLGNRVENVGFHVVRIWHVSKGVVSHNYLANPGQFMHVIKLHNSMASGAPATEDGQFVQIADNDIHGANEWSVTIGPQNGQVDERVRNLIYERNRSYNSGVDVCIWARNITVRNNLFVGSATNPYPTSVGVGRRGIEPASDNVKVYNNTVFQSGHPSLQYVAFNVEPIVTNSMIENNLVCMPDSNVPIVLVGGTPSAGVNNMVVPVTDFLDAALNDFRLTAGSTAVDAGNALKEVREDFAELSRLLMPDIGAHER